MCAMVVEVVEWSVISPSTPTIRVRNPLKATIFIVEMVLKIIKEAGKCPLLRRKSYELLHLKVALSGSEMLCTASSD